MDLKATLKETLHEMGFGNQENAEVKQLRADNARLTADNQRLATENEQYRTAESERSLSVLTAAREKATRFAVTAYGQDSTKLAAAKERIGVTSDLDTLGIITDSLELAAKNVANPGQQSRNHDPATEGDDTLLASLNAAKADGEKANKPREGGR